MILFIYCGKPVQKILFKTKVILSNIEYSQIDLSDEIYYLDKDFSVDSKNKTFMRLQLTETYTDNYFDLINLLNNGLSSAPQGPMRMSEQLSLYINSHDKVYFKETTLKDAVISALKLLGGKAHRNDIYDKIIEKNLYSFSTGKTPIDSISAVLQSNSKDSSYGKDNTFYSVYGISSRKGIWGLTNYLHDTDIYPETADLNDCYEGAKTTVTVNRYERNTEARQKCINHHGCYCHICNLDFEKVYGELGNGFIHVHHIKPLHEIKEGYIVDPINDLIPVCPNCHAMLHRKLNGKNITIDELKDMITF